MKCFKNNHKQTLLFENLELINRENQKSNLILFENRTIMSNTQLFLKKLSNVDFSYQDVSGKSIEKQFVKDETIKTFLNI